MGFFTNKAYNKEKHYLKNNANESIGGNTMNDVQFLDDFDQAVEESIHDDEIDALLESLSVDSDIDDDAEPAEEGIVGAAVGITMAVAGFTVMIASFKTMLNDMKRKRILKKHPEIANKIGDCLNDVNTECFKSFESAIKKNAYFKSSEYKKVKKQKANDDDMKKFTSDCKFSVQDSNNAVTAKMVSSLRTPTYTFEYKTLEDDNANDEYIEKNIEPVENKILSEYKNVLASAITTFNSSKAKATVESKYGCKINVAFNGVDSDADADHYESNDEDIRTEYYWAYGNISIEVTFDAGKTDTKADTIDNDNEDITGAKESVTFEDDSDFDDDSLDSATESSMFLDMMMESCDDLNEFQDLVTENAYDWEMYGLIDDAQSALEATKVMRVENWKEKNRKRLINRECIRIAMKKGDPNYTKYKKYRDLMREYREKLFEKYTPMATRNVKAAQQNARHKAANMHTAGGKDVNARINKAMNKSIAGHNPTNAPAKSNAS